MPAPAFAAARRLDHGRREGRRPDDDQAVTLVGRVGQVAGPPAVVEGAADGRLDRRRRGVLPERHPEQHRGREDRADRVGHVLAGDVGCGPVDRLVEPERAVRRPALPERRRGQHPEDPGQHRRLVGEDVAEEVLGDDDVEVGRSADQQHRARVHELMVERDVRVRLAPTSSAMVRHSREVARTFALSTEVTCCASGPGQLEREPDDAADFDLGVGQRVERGPGPGRAGRPRAGRRSRSRRSARGRSAGRRRRAAPGRSGDEATSAGWTVTGRRFA